MAENKNDQHSRQSADNSGQQIIQHSLELYLVKMNIKVREIEEWDTVITDQRRPQFRASKNYGRRNY